MLKVPWILLLVFFSFFDWFHDGDGLVDLSYDNPYSLVELCANGLDDDLDGLIDINDPDCICEPIVDFYIPNPSFEDTLCCPCTLIGGDCVGTGDFCVSPWLKNVDAGADHYHTCADYSASFLLPYDPNIESGAVGDSYIGILSSGNSSTPGFIVKEYLGICLNAVLNAGEEYQVEFDLGFSTQGVIDQLEIGVFGTQSCANWPYLVGNDVIFGCPRNNYNYLELSAQVVTGNDEWTRVELTFTPPIDISLLAFGPSCGHTRNNNIDYHFLDNFNLFSLADNSVNISIVPGGNPCQGDAGLSIRSPAISSTYQWYKDGVAILGETDTTYALPGGNASNGEYIVRIENDKGCFLSLPRPFATAPIFTVDSMTICEGQSFQFGNSLLTTEGDYVDTLLSQFDCDSIVDFHLRVLPVFRSNNEDSIYCNGDQPTHFPLAGLYFDTIRYTNFCDSLITRQEVVILPTYSKPVVKSICEGDIYLIGSNQFTVTGLYFPVLSAQNGCDSTIELDLTVVEPIKAYISKSRCENETLVYQGRELSAAGEYSFDFISSIGCDSSVIVTVVDNVDPVTVPDSYEVKLGDSVLITVDVDPAAVLTSVWQEHPALSSLTQLTQYMFAISNTILVLETTDTSGCQWIDEVEIHVISNYTVFVPTGFTPTDDGRNVNDVLRPYVESDVSSISSFTVFNRWGDVVYEMAENMPANILGDATGWNGKLMNSGMDAPVGVYIYYGRAQFIDGTSKPFMGDVTLLR